MKKTFSENKGFSLIELLIVLAVMFIMLSAAMMSYNSTRSGTKLEAAERELASAIKLAQSYALQGKTVDDAGNQVSACGFGVLSRKQFYFIFYNLPGDGEDCEKANKSSLNRRYDSDVSQKIGNEDYYYSGGVFIDLELTPFNQRQIYFTVPNAQAFGSDGRSFADEKKIIFSTGTGGSTIELTVGPGGAVTEN